MTEDPTKELLWIWVQYLEGETDIKPPTYTQHLNQKIQRDLILKICNGVMSRQEVINHLKKGNVIP